MSLSQFILRACTLSAGPIFWYSSEKKLFHSNAWPKYSDNQFCLVVKWNNFRISYPTGAELTFIDFSDHFTQFKRKTFLWHQFLFSKITNAKLLNINRCDKCCFKIYRLCCKRIFRIDRMPIKNRKTFTKLFHFRSERSKESSAVGKAIESSVRSFWLDRAKTVSGGKITLIR